MVLRKLRILGQIISQYAQLYWEIYQDRLLNALAATIAVGCIVDWVYIIKEEIL